MPVTTTEIALQRKMSATFQREVRELSDANKAAQAVLDDIDRILARIEASRIEFNRKMNQDGYK